MVILTAPPVLQSGEALMIASAATSVMLVARARTTHVEALAESAVRLSKVGRFPAGVLLNAA
jgi:Mrp family chromosome partitioning ATPase